MMTASSTSNRNCPRCGAGIPAGSPEGLCPGCLLAMNLATQTELTAEPGPHGTRRIDAPPVLPPRPDEISPLFPQLEILECLGRGGMGVVYKARQKSLDRLVALKLLAPERANDPAFAARFQREAQALARLNHANIVTIHDFGQAGGFYFLLMEYVDGVNLRQLLRTKKLSPGEALAIVPPLCDALQFAHERGIVHRDIKPENLLLDRAGRIKIADFGIARMLGTPADAESVEAPGNAAATESIPSASPQGATGHTAAGTPGYMAPEQTSAPQTVDARADIYSLGVVFYEMLTGELPGSRMQPPSQKVQIDVRLDEIVLRALAKTPELRWQTAAELRTQVATITQTDPIPSPASRLPSARRQTLRGILVGLLVFIAVMSGATLISSWLPKSYEARVRVTGANPDDLLSSEVLTRVARELELSRTWSTDGATRERTEAEILRELRRRIVLEVTAGSDMATLRVRSDRPSEAPNLANRIAEGAGALNPQLRIIEQADGPGHLVFPNYAAVTVGSTATAILLGLASMLFYRRRSAREARPTGLPTDRYLATAPRLGLVLVMASLVIPVAGGSIFSMFTARQRAEELRDHAYRSARAQQAMVTAQARVNALTQELRQMLDRQQHVSHANPPEALRIEDELVPLRARKAAADEQLADANRGLQEASIRYHSEVRPGPWLFLIPALLFGIPGTVLGWRHLQAIRGIPAPRPMAASAMGAALLWPLLVLSAAVGLAALLPFNHGRWTTLGITLGITAVLLFNFWAVRSVLHWLNGRAGFAPAAPGSPAPGPGTKRFLGALLLALALLVPLGWLVAIKAENSRQMQRWHLQMTGLQRDWSRAVTDRFQAQVALDRHAAGTANLPTQEDKTAAEEQRRRLTQRLGAAEARVATLDAQMRSLSEVDAVRRQRSTERMLPAIFLGPSLGFAGILLLRRSRSATENRSGLLRFLLLAGAAALLALGLGFLVFFAYAFLGSPTRQEPGDEPELPARIESIQLDRGTARIRSLLDDHSVLSVHLGASNAWRVLEGAGRFETTISPSEAIPMSNDRTGTGFIIQSALGTGSNVISRVNVATAGVLHLRQATQMEEESGPSGRWLLGEVIESNGRATPVWVAITQEMNPILTTTASRPGLGENASPKTNLPIDPVSEVEQRVLRTHYEKTLGELLEAQKELGLVEARVEPTNEAANQLEASLKRKIQVLIEQREVLRRKLETGE